jgi:hypothetical protein
MLAVAVERHFVGTRTRHREMFEAQVDIGVAQAGDSIFADRLVLDLGAKNRIAFDPTKFNIKVVLSFPVATDLHKEPKWRQRRAKIRNQKTVKQTHQAELPRFLFPNVIAQCGEKNLGHRFRTAFRHGPLSQADK